MMVKILIRSTNVIVMEYIFIYITFLQHWWWHTPAGCSWSQNRPAFVPCLGSSYSRLSSLSSEIDKTPSALNRGPIQVGWSPVGQQIQLEVNSFFFIFAFCNPGFKVPKLSKRPFVEKSAACADIFWTGFSYSNVCTKLCFHSSWHFGRFQWF